MTWVDELVAERPAGAKYVAYGGELEFMAATQSDTAGRTAKFRLIRAPEEVLQAHPFAKFTRKRRGHAGSRFEVSFAQVDGPQELMMEAMLLNWSDGPQGSAVVLAIDSSLDQHPFMGCTRASKEAPGTRYMAIFLEKDDDEQLVQQEKVALLEKAKRTGKHQLLSNVAAQMAKSTRFHDWLREVSNLIDEWTPARAGAWLKATIGVASKSELDSTGPEGKKPVAAFHKVRRAYVAWQDEQGFAPEE